MERSAAERISGFVGCDPSAEELIDCEKAAEGGHNHKQRPARAFAEEKREAGPSIKSEPDHEEQRYFAKYEAPA